MKRFLQILLISALSFFSVKASPNENFLTRKDSKETIISYSIEPFYDVSLFRLLVVLEFKGESSGQTTLRLPNNFGSNKDWEGVKLLKPLSQNTTIEPTSENDVKIVKYPPSAIVRIYYQFEQVRDSDVELGNHYMATIDRKYFHFLGETFFVYPDWDSNSNYTFRLSWNKFPIKWNIANSFGVNQRYQEVTLPLWKFRHTIFTGGNFVIEKRMINNYPVFFSIKGDYSFPIKQLVDLTQTILFEERTFWNDFNFPFFLITVFPIEGDNDQGGTGRVNSFALFLSKDRQIDYRMKRLLAHEIFHTWVGEKINLSGSESLLYWFSEGFTDYYARLILLRAGLISLEEYVKEYNKVLKQYFKSSERNAKNERTADGFWNDSDLNKLTYMRGDILAHSINYAIIKNSNAKKSLDDLMLDLFKRSKEEGLLVSTGSISNLIRFYGGDKILTDIMKVLNSGAAIKPNPDALGSCVEMKLESSRRFWLFGEKLEFPVYNLKSKQIDKRCYYWFGVK